jgi:prepilin-type N-terminal cleavage/methylation domain-containing protein
MRRARDHQGLTLIEVLIAAAILAVGLLALLSVFPIGYVDVNVSGGQSKATAYGQQMLEQLKNQTFNPGPLNQTDTPEPGYSRTWTIAQEPGTNPPNRLARIQVTVVWTRGDRSQTVALETMRAE